MLALFNQLWFKLKINFLSTLWDKLSYVKPAENTLSQLLKSDKRLGHISIIISDVTKVLTVKFYSEKLYKFDSS